MKLRSQVTKDFDFFAKKILWLAIFFSVNLAAQVHPSANPDAGKKYVEGQMLVKFRPGTSAKVMSATHRAVAADVVQSFGGTNGLQLVKIPSTSTVSQAVAAYRSNPSVQYAEPNYILHALQTPNDSLFSSMWSLLNTGQVGGKPGADIKATQAWDITTGSKNVVVAVIDTGVDYNHPDLAGNIFNGPICPGGVVCHGMNAITQATVSDPLDDNGHGTHVSGTIGAVVNNRLGVTGINWNVTILPCKFLDNSGFGDTAAAIRCLDFIKGLKDGGMNIVASNNSWGGGPFSQALQDAIDRQRQSGILFIAAAGNDFSDNDTLPSYPSSFALPNIISVAATDRNDQRAFFSNLGRHSVHVGAPGQDILSTFLGGGYEAESGTSMAAPHVTGVIALLAAQDPTRDWRALKNLVIASGDANTSLALTISGRRLNAFAAMTCTNAPLAARLLPATDVFSGSVGVPITLASLNINCAQPAGPVQVTVMPGGQTIVLADDGLGADVAAGDGIYTGSFVPQGTGVYTLTFSTGSTVTVQVLTNYQPSPSAYNYRAISGTSLDLGDEGAAQITPPFPIAFGNGSFTKLWASANGTISFNTAFSSYVNVFMPTGAPLIGVPPVGQSTTLVAPFWEDLFPLKGTAQNVFWDVLGTAPNRELVVEWRDVRAYQCSKEQDTIKFQVVFFESNSDVLFNYADTIFGGNCANHDRGGLATVGVQVAPTVGTQWGRDGQEVTDGMALIWHVSSASPQHGPPTVTSITPAVVDAYGPDFTLTVNGANFFPDTRVQRAGGFDRITTYVSSTQLNALIPASDIDLFNVFNFLFYGARNGDPFDTNSSSFNAQLTINNPSNPVITSVSPTTGNANGFGFLLTVNGNQFVPFSVLNVNGQQVSTSALSRTRLQAIVPGGFVSTMGTVALTVTNPAPGGGTSAPFSYTVAASSSSVPTVGAGSFLLQHGLEMSLPAIIAQKNIDQRFLGWNYAQQAGQDYLYRFTRPYGAMFTASPQDKPAGLTGSAGIQTSTVPPLVGLNLRQATPAGFIPTGVAVGDLNRDGHLDWIVSNGGSNDLWVYLGNGDGTSQLPRVISLTGQTPVQIIAADLRGIGILDLILAEPDSISVGVLLGNGDGTFGPENLYYAPAPVLSIAVADFNQDGHLDVVAGLLGTNETGGVAFFAGDGNGKLQPPMYTPVATIFSNPVVAVELAVGDLNGDGIPDLMVVDQDEVGNSGAYTYFGVGDGTFKPGENLGGFWNAAIGDLNGDGCNDVVTLDFFGTANVSLGHCDGTFSRLPGTFEFGVGESGIGMALVDVNGDGKLDLVTSGVDLFGLGSAFGQESGALVSVMLGDGAGSFENARVFRAQSGMVALAIGDLNGDSHPDIVVPSQDTDSVSVLMNDGTGNFGGPQGQYVGWNQKGNPISGGNSNVPLAAYVADVDGDGRLDVVAVDGSQFGGLPSSVSVSLNDGTGRFLPDIKSPILDGVVRFGNLVLGDFRNTGRPDLIVTPDQFDEVPGVNYFAFVPNSGLGHFGQPVINLMTHPPGTLAVGDFNGDGKLDFVMVGFSGAATTPAVSTFLGNGDGTFRVGPIQQFVAGFPPGAVYVGDFNADGKLDLLVPITVGITGTATMLEFLGNGDGSFAPPRTVINGSPTGTSVVANLFNVVDVNHDGRPDIIEKEPSNGLAPPIFHIFLGQPDGSFVLTYTYLPYSGGSVGVFGAALQFTETFVGDFNGDGNVDIVSMQRDAGFPGAKYAQFLLGNGDGTFTPTFNRSFLGITGNAALPAITGDMNGDGRADFVELDGFTSAFQVISATPGTSLFLQFAALPVIGSTATVRASLAVAPAAPISVALSTSDPAIVAPASITIPAGALSQDATVQVGSGFDRSKTLAVTATVPGESSTAIASVATPGGAVGLVVSIANTLFRALLPGQSTGDLVLIVGSRGGYETSVKTRCDGLPAGATCVFGATTMLIPSGGVNSTSLVVSMGTRLPIGNYPFQVVVSDAAISQALPLTLQVGDFAVALLDSSAVGVPTGFSTVQIAVTSINNFQGSVNFTCQGLPAGATCLQTIANPGLTTSQPVTLQTTNVPVGNYPFTITGDTGSTTHSVNAVLHIGDIGNGVISPSAATLSVGQSEKFALTVNSVNGLGGSVSLFCNPSVNGHFASGVQCAFAPQQVTFAAGKLTSQLTVTVTSRPAVITNTNQAKNAPSSSPWMALMVVPIAALFAGTKTKRHIVFRALFVGIIALSVCTACGGGGGAGNSPAPTPPPSPTTSSGPVTINLDVVATSALSLGNGRTVASITVTVP